MVKGKPSKKPYLVRRRKLITKEDYSAAIRQARRASTFAFDSATSSPSRHPPVSLRLVGQLGLHDGAIIMGIN
ncbi:hypothetical protein HPP92_001870, partial [Vanilla planifolia]